MFHYINCKNGSRYSRADYVNMFYPCDMFIYVFSWEFTGVLTNLVTDFIVYFSTTCDFIVAILGLKTQYCVFLTFIQSLFAHNQLYMF